MIATIALSVILTLTPLNAAFLGTVHALDPSTYKINSYQLIATGKMYCGMYSGSVHPSEYDLSWVYKSNHITAAQGAAVQQAAIQVRCPEIRNKTWQLP